jgi:hypothetical protein
MIPIAVRNPAVIAPWAVRHSTITGVTATVAECARPGRALALSTALKERVPVRPSITTSLTHSTTVRVARCPSLIIGSSKQLHGG